MTTAAPPSKISTYAVWCLQILAAAAFVAAGSFKLIGDPQMVAVFDQIGVGQWFRYITGAIEVVCGLALLTARSAQFGAAILAATMACAVLTHVFVIGGSPVPAVVLLAITSAIVWLLRG